MKQIPMLIVLGLALTLCNLTSKLKSGSNSNSSGGSGTSSSGSGDAVEKAHPSAAETAALAGGQEIKWEQQGISWTVPPKWTKSSDDKHSLLWRSPGGDEAANLIGTVSTMSDDFPVDASLKAEYEASQQRMKHGELDQLRWLEIDGVKGMQFRESNPEKPDGLRRMQWIAFRKFAGEVQQVNIMLSSNGKGFPGHQDEMNGVLYSMKLAH
jgi:hypothetical protein